MDASRLNQLSFLTLFVCFAVESPPGAEINTFQSEPGIILENITLDSRFGFSDAVVILHTSLLLTCCFYMIRIQITGCFINVHSECSLRLSTISPIMCSLSTSCTKQVLRADNPLY